MINNEKIENIIRDNKENVLLTGPEGEGKTTDLTDCCLKHNHEEYKLMIMACSSYYLAREKIKTFTTYLNYPLDYFQIVVDANYDDEATDSNGEQYINYSTNKQCSTTILPKTRVILTSHACVQKLSYKDFDYSAKGENFEIVMIIYDELNFENAVNIPLSLRNDKSINISESDIINELSIIKEKKPADLEKAVLKRFTKYDYNRLMRADRTTLLVPQWLSNCNPNNKVPRTIILSSEKLSSLILSTIGFKVIDISTNRTYPNCKLRYLNHSSMTVHFLKSLQEIIERDNIKIFEHYPLIISDVIKVVDGLLENIRSHSGVHGSNAHMDLDVCLLHVTAVPSFVINIIVSFYKDKLNLLNIKEPEHLYEMITNMYYSDRIRQSAGRILGARSKDRVRHVDCIINDSLTNTLNAQYFPYEIEQITLDDFKFNSDIKQILIDLFEKEGKYKENNKLINKEKQRLNKDKRLKRIDVMRLDKLFTLKDDSVIYYDDLETIATKLEYHVGWGKSLRPIDIISYFSKGVITRSAFKNRTHLNMIKNSLNLKVVKNKKLSKNLINSYRSKYQTYTSAEKELYENRRKDEALLFNRIKEGDKTVKEVPLSLIRDYKDELIIFLNIKLPSEIEITTMYNDFKKNYSVFLSTKSLNGHPVNVIKGLEWNSIVLSDRCDECGVDSSIILNSIKR